MERWAEFGPSDLVSIDAGKRSNAEHLEWALRISRQGTLIVADSVVRGGAVADGVESGGDPRVEGGRVLFERLAASRA